MDDEDDEEDTAPTGEAWMVWTGMVALVNLATRVPAAAAWTNAVTAVVGLNDGRAFTMEPSRMKVTPPGYAVAACSRRREAPALGVRVPLMEVNSTLCATVLLLALDRTAMLYAMSCCTVWAVWLMLAVVIWYAKSYSNEMEYVSDGKPLEEEDDEVAAYHTEPVDELEGTYEEEEDSLEGKAEEEEEEAETERARTARRTKRARNMAREKMGKRAGEEGGVESMRKGE